MYHGRNRGTNNPAYMAGMYKNMCGKSVEWMMIRLLKKFENRGEANFPLFLFDTNHLSPYISPKNSGYRMINLQ
jgi:hypothetical protein